MYHPNAKRYANDSSSVANFEREFYEKEPFSNANVRLEAMYGRDSVIYWEYMTNLDVSDEESSDDEDPWEGCHFHDD